MFESVENNRKMILGAYRKLKSYYYYDKTILYNKISLAMWESDSHSFENRVNRLAKFMCTLENEIDYNYLTPLMRSIVLVPMPKAFEEPQTEDNGILIQNVVPQNSILSKVNFYIKTPVELLILDAIWMLMVGKIAYQQSSISSCAYANRPKFDQLYKNADSLYSGIDFASNRLFVPYFKQYTAWRNNAFKKVKSRYKNQQDSVLISLDIRSYYYSVIFDFENLPRYLNYDSRLTEIAPLTRIIRQIYIDYTSEMKKFRGAIPADCTKGQCALPIGLHSSMLLANLYLYELDKAISEQMSPVYYGRYVDDILIVIDKPCCNEMTVTSILHKTLVKCKIIEPKNLKEYNVLIPNTSPHYLTLQSEKIRCIYFDHNEPDALIKSLCEASNIQASMSEGTLMPDIGFSERSFDEQAYSLGERTGALKVRSLAAAMRKVGICEERGSGYDKVISYVEKYNLPAPLITEYERSTKVSLFAKKEFDELTKKEKIAACYAHVSLNYVKNKPSTNGTLRARFQLGENERYKISRVFNDACEAKLIKAREGTGMKNREYIPYWAPNGNI